MPSSPGDRAPKRNNARLEWRGRKLKCGLVVVGSVALSVHGRWVASDARGIICWRATEVAARRAVNRRFGLKESPRG